MPTSISIFFSFFFTIDESINALECVIGLVSIHSNYFQICTSHMIQKIFQNYIKDLKSMLTYVEARDINALDLADEKVSGVEEKPS